MRLLRPLLVSTLLAPPMHAAHEPVYAIVGARIVPVSRAPIVRGSLVLRGGSIEAVGTDVGVPPDARVIDASGLVVTPGLVDGFGALGLPARKGTDKDAEKPDAIAPRQDALRLLQVSEALKARDSGITSALVIPGEGILPGRSVLVSLVGDEAEGMALVQPAGLHLHMATQASQYPDSLMGTVALARQSLADAVRYRDEWAAYRRSPLGKKRPAYDSNLEAWQDVIARRIPLVVGASRENDLRRALALAEEFQVDVVAAGAPQAARVAELIKTRRLPLVVGVNFDPPREGGSFGLEDDERERQDIAEAERNPARLHEQGVAFGFGSGFASDYLGGIRKAIERGLPREAALRAATLGAAEALGVADRLGSLDPGKLANVVVWSAEPLSKDARPRYVFVDGQLYEPLPRDEDRQQPEKKPEDARRAEPEVGPWAPPAPPAPASGVTAIVGGTLLTAGPAGSLEGATLLIERGRIAAVGRDLQVPAGARVIDAAGRFVTPGLIDTHSHTAIEDDVNECTDVVTAETRIRDVIDQHDPSIYRQLAGGVTTINVLHGSCNAIGGQSAVLKLRWGQPPEGLLFGAAPRSIKFALGENPKRANSRRPGERRYPATRMGVEQVIRNAFAEAAAYKAEWEAYEEKAAQAARAGPPPVAPRRDLRLETLRDILEGRILVHSHAYRADEMLMLMQVAEDYGFKVRTFQHGLEAYKVASEIARHGAGVGTFIDWWGFKLEAFDATPFNPAILSSHGVRVSLNSDSDELARRLYWDAAKAVRYGGVSEDEALRMITLHAAWQLGVDQRTGSLEPGKDADIAVFAAHPFSPEARVELTLVDGVVYFDGSAAARAGRGAGR
jgi:imidazolonepropionase-like amidohydrolase